MPVGTPALRGANDAVDSNAAIAVTLDQALTAGSKAICRVAIRGESMTPAQPAAPTSVSGGGVTWTLDVTNNWDNSSGSRATTFTYVATATTPSGTTVTVTPATPSAGTYSHIMVDVVEVPDAGDVIQNTATPDGATLDLDLAVSTMADTVNNVFIVYAHLWVAGVAKTFTWDTGFTELSDRSLLQGADREQSVGVAYDVGNATSNPTLTATPSGTATAGGLIVYEIAAATATTYTITELTISATAD